MMKNLIFYLSLSFVWLVAGCSEKDKLGNYSNGVNPESIYDVQAYTLNDSSLWRFPLQMEYTDSLLVVLDYMDDYYFHVYTLKGEPIGHFARKGQGPGELLSANQFHLSEDKGSLYVYDGVSRKIVMYLNSATHIVRNKFKILSNNILPSILPCQKIHLT